jgi:hypothetical protein
MKGVTIIRNWYMPYGYHGLKHSWRVLPYFPIVSFSMLTLPIYPAQSVMMTADRIITVYIRNLAKDPDCIDRYGKSNR